MEEYFSKLESDRHYSSRVVSALRQMDLDKIDIPLIVSLLKYISLNMGDGAILVFLPGIGEGGEREEEKKEREEEEREKGKRRGRRRKRRGRKRKERLKSEYLFYNCNYF